MPGHRRTNVQVAADRRAACSARHAICIEAEQQQQLDWTLAHHQQHHQQQQQPCSSTAQQTRALLQQLDALGWDKVAQVSEDLSCITLHLRDASNRVHSAAIQLSGFPVAAPVVSIELPVSAWKPRWLPGHTLCQLVSQLQQVLDSFRVLWEQLEDLDQHTQLLDTQQALAKPYACSRRCVALGSGCSCQLQLDPGRPLALPQLVFHGPSSKVAEMQSRWFGSAHAVWDEQQSVRDNLQNVLQLSLPAPKPGTSKGCAAVLAARASPAAAAAAGGAPGPAEGNQDVLLSDADDSDDDGEGVGACAICYALHLPNPAQPEALGDAPSISCTGPACGRTFHAACLAEWLGALPNSRRVFDTLFGSCPFCNTDISVSTRAVVGG